MTKSGELTQTPTRTDDPLVTHAATPGTCCQTQGRTRQHRQSKETNIYIYIYILELCISPSPSPPTPHPHSRPLSAHHDILHHHHHSPSPSPPGFVPTPVWILQCSSRRRAANKRENSTTGSDACMGVFRGP